jgi:long-subunit acyl-CoA synthetase (AMP-forming)
MRARRDLSAAAIIAVLDPQSMQPVPADGQTMGEIFFRGNLVMKGYLKNAQASAEAFAAAGSTPATWRWCRPTAT